MKIELKNVHEIQTTAARFPRYIRKPRAVQHLTSICTGYRAGFDIGRAYFRDGTCKPIFWGDNLTLEDVRDIRASNKYAEFVFTGYVWDNNEIRANFAEIIGIVVDAQKATLRDKTLRDIHHLEGK